MNRRGFLSGLGAGALSFGLANNLSAANIGDVKSERSVIFLFLGGGISIADSFNPKPFALPECRPINGSIQTKSDYLLGADFPNLAKVSDKVTPVHNFKTFDGNHNSASAYVYSGHPAFGLAEGAPSKNPSYGSLISYTHGERNGKNGLPNYIKINKTLHDGAGWLGSKYIGFANDEDGIRNLKINVTPESFTRRNEMVNELEKLSGRNDHYFTEWSNLRNSARDIVMGQAAQAFNLKNEKQEWLDKYQADKGGFGKSCLLARRMIEAGAKFVTLEHGGWDMHQGISEGMKNRSVDLDLHLTNLILDLESKGMNKNTMIVVTSEFGRTKLNVSAGKDHNPNITALLLIGGNYGDRVIGKSDKDSLSIDELPFKPEDLSYTILNWLEVPSSYTITDNLGRPRHLVENGARIIV